MAKIRWRQQVFRLAAILLGMAVLVSLLRRTGASTVIDQVKTVGWGLVLVIALGGIAHLTKTLAWRCTFLCDIRDIPFARMFGLRLVSESIGSFGLPGQVLGETARVHLLGSALPVANSISSVTLDRGIYIVTSALVSVSGILAALLLRTAFWNLAAVCVLVCKRLSGIACRNRNGYSKALASAVWRCEIHCASAVV